MLRVTAHGPNCAACRRLARQRAAPAAHERRCEACDGWFVPSRDTRGFCGPCARELNAITAALATLACVEPAVVG